MLLNIIRAVFVLVVSGLGVRLASASGSAYAGLGMFISVLAIAAIVMTVDILTPRKRVQSISAVYLGLIVGLILSNYLQLALEPTIAAIFDRLKASSDVKVA